MGYTASSVKREIDAKKTLTVNGDLRCPQSTEWLQHDSTPCPQVPESCSHARVQECKQRIHIHEQGTKLIILTFRFTISQTNHDGFIDEHDQQLELLIRRGKNSETYSLDVAQFDKC